MVKDYGITSRARVWTVQHKDGMPLDVHVRGKWMEPVASRASALRHVGNQLLNFPCPVSLVPRERDNPQPFLTLLQQFPSWSHSQGGGRDLMANREGHATVSWQQERKVVASSLRRNIQFNGKRTMHGEGMFCPWGTDCCCFYLYHQIQPGKMIYWTNTQTIYTSEMEFLKKIIKHSF